MNSELKIKIALVSLFALVFGFVESSVVVYLRAIYYPGGFTFPLHVMSSQHVSIELFREFSTIIMLLVVGVLAGKSRWQRLGYFLLAFGIWDIFYYIWLKIFLNWPSSIFDWDILFLIPLPWIGPVIAPVLISLLMIVGGILIARIEQTPGQFHPSKTIWLITAAGTFIILYSFLYDVNATLHLQSPKPYQYEIFAAGMAMYALALIFSMRPKKHPA